jgi:transcriptional regulator with XRE-family HTH domain
MARNINPAALRTTRQLVGVSCRELGRRCGISAASISKLELGRNGASPTMMRLLADVLGVPLDAITSPVPEPGTRSAA